MLYGGRILCGLCQGFCNCLTIVYVLEFCQNVKEKAICGVLLSLVGNSGTLIIYLFGIFLNWRELAGVCILFAIPYVLGIIVCLPNDFPYWKLSKRKSYTRTNEKFFDEETSSDMGLDKVRNNRVGLKF